MSTQAIIITCLLCLVVGSAAGHVIGFAVGLRRGRDEQWIDDFISAGAKDRARRHRNGQFKSKEDRS